MNSTFELTLGYLNPALNNSAQVLIIQTPRTSYKILEGAMTRVYGHLATNEIATKPWTNNNNKDLKQGRRRRQWNRR